MSYRNLFSELIDKPVKIPLLYLDQSNPPILKIENSKKNLNKSLCFLYNSVFNRLYCYDENNKYYEFIIDIDENPKLICGSYNLASGFKASSIVLKCNHPELDFKLIFKCRHIIKRVQTYYDKWNNFHYNIYYKIIKSIMGRVITICYLYGNNLVHNSKKDESGNSLPFINEHMTEEFKLKQNEDITFGIYKFYNEKITELKEKFDMISILISFLIFIQIEGYWIYDFSFANIKFDRIDGKLIFVLIDFDGKLCAKYKISHKGQTYIQIFDHLSTAPFMSCCFRKQLSILLELQDSTYIDQIYAEADIEASGREVGDSTYKYKYIYPKIINKLKKTTAPIIDIEGRFDKYLTKYPIYFDKFNYFTLVDFIINLFYKTYGTLDNGTTYEFNMDQLLYSNRIGVSNFKLNNYTKVVRKGGKSMIDHWRATQNLNDIRILKILLYGEFKDDRYTSPVLEKNDDVDKKLSDIINYFLFDNVTETGVFAPDYENNGICYLMLKFIQEQFNLGSNIFELHKDNLDSNIGTDKVKNTTVEDYERLFNDSFKITNIGQDVIDFFIRSKILSGIPNINNLSYEKWALLRLVEQLLDRPDNRTIENLENPPKNSTLPQNYYIYIDEFGKEQIVTKWKKNSQPTVAQPTVAQPTVAQPTVAQPISQSKELSINSSVRKKLELKPRTIQSSSTVAQTTVAQTTVAQPTVAQPTVAQPTVAQPTVAQPTTDKPRRTLEMLDKEWNLEKDEYLTEDMPDFKEKIDIQPFSPLNVGQLYDKTAEYMEVLKGIQSSKYREYITPEQQFLNKTPMRLYAILLAYHIKNGLSLNIQTKKPETKSTTEKPKSISTIKKPKSKSTPKDTGIDPGVIYGPEPLGQHNPIVAYKYFKYKDKYLKLKNQLNN